MAAGEVPKRGRGLGTGRVVARFSLSVGRTHAVVRAYASWTAESHDARALPGCRRYSGFGPAGREYAMRHGKLTRELVSEQLCQLGVEPLDLSGAQS